MSIPKLQQMTLSYKARHSCGVALYKDLSKSDPKVYKKNLSYVLDKKIRNISFTNDLDKIILGYFYLNSKIAILVIDVNGDYYLVNKLNNIKPLNILEVLECSKYNSVVLEWYQTIFAETYNVDLYSRLPKQQINLYEKKGFGCNVIGGFNCIITAFSKPIVRKYSIIIHECLNNSNGISYILEDKKKKLVFFFETLSCLADSELAKQHSISAEFVEYIPNTTPYYALA